MPLSIRKKRTKLRDKSAGSATAVSSKRASGATEVHFVGTKEAVPEWMTEAWKRHVEAEARRQLKDRIHDVGAHR